MRVCFSTFLLFIFSIQVLESNFRFGVSAQRGPRCFQCQNVYDVMECTNKTTRCNTGDVCQTEFRLEQNSGIEKYKINKRCFQKEACDTAEQQNEQTCRNGICVYCCGKNKCKTMDICSKKECAKIIEKSGMIPTRRETTTTVATTTTTVPPTTTRSICDVSTDFLPLTSSAVVIEGQLSVSNTSLVSINCEFFNSTVDQLLQNNEFKLQIQANVTLDCLKITYENISNTNSTIQPTNQTNHIRMLLRCRIYNPLPSYTTTPLPTTSNQSINISSPTAATILKSQRRALLEDEPESHTSTKDTVELDLETHTSTRDPLELDRESHTSTRDSLQLDLESHTSTRDSLQLGLEGHTSTRDSLQLDWENYTSTGALSLEETSLSNKSELSTEENTTSYLYEIYIVEGQVLTDSDELLDENAKRILACENITYIRLDFMIKPPIITSEPRTEPEPDVAALGPVELGLIGASVAVIAGFLLLVGFKRWKVHKSLQRREARISPLHESASY